MASSMHFILIILLNLGLTLQQENQNYLNYHQPQGRFLSSFPQNSRNGFFPSAPGRPASSQQQVQSKQPGSYQQHDLYLDGPSTSSFFPFQTFATTRPPNPFEISPRPFGVTTSPLQSRGQFSSFGQTSGRQSGFQFESNPYNFAPSAQQQQPQRLNPYLDSTGYDESPISEYDERQTFINTPKTRGGSSFQRASDENRSIERVPSHSTSNKSNKDRFLQNLRQRPTTTVPTSSETTTPKARVTKEQPSKRTRYTPITRSTTSKRPQPKQTESDIEYNDQKYAFTKNNKVKSSLNVRPLHGYHVNITHGENEQKNALSVKALNVDNTREEVNEHLSEEEENEYEYDDDIEYIDDDNDYAGVILNEEDRARKEKNYSPVTSTSRTITTSSSTTKKVETTTPGPLITTTNKQEENTRIIFDNFILPKKEESEEDNKSDNEDEEIEYEYEYEDESEVPEIKSTTKPTSKEPESEEKIEVTTFKNPNRILSEAVVSVVTSKTVINGTIPKSSEEDADQTFIEETTLESENYPPTRPTLLKSTTDSNYVVIASVQTSRSVSGAHFLPFPHVEQKEIIQSRSELTNKKNPKELETATDLPQIQTTQISEAENVSAEVQDDDDLRSSAEFTTSLPYSLEEAPSTVPTTIRSLPLPSTESIIDKLDGIQSDLSLGVLSGEFPVLKDTSSKKSKVHPASPTEIVSSNTEDSEKEVEVTTTVKPLVLIRKFSPRTQPTTKKPVTTTIKVTIKTTTEEPVTTTQNNSVIEANQRSNKKISFDEIPNDDLADLLPPGYKLRTSYKNKKFGTTTSQPSTIKEESAPGKLRNATISRSFKSQPATQDVNTKPKSKDKFIPPKSENDTTKKISKLFETSSDEIDLSKFLPPDFKEKEKNGSLAVIPIESDELSKFLPPGFKLEPTTSTTNLPKVKVVAEDISKFLPPGYKPAVLQKDEKEDDKPDISSIFSKIKFQEASNLSPPGFTETTESSITAKPAVEEISSTTKSNKLIFPTRFGKKPARVTTPKASAGEGPKPVGIEIRKGPPTRATTEFTGWPSKPTTPFSLEKFLEIQKNAMQIDISEILARSTTEEITSTISMSTTSTTTTTTSTTPRPREATICKTDCSLAATIRIIDGIEWSPELLTHHTEEYKNLAAELEADLNEVYTKSEILSKWFKSVRIDSFSKGSVLVDYFIELKDIQNEMNTTEIKRLFHETLEPISMQKNITIENENEALPQPIVKEAFKLGNFVVDPISTDFIVIQKVATLPNDEDDEDVLLPQWAIAMISIGLLSLVFVILFGVAVLINRKKAAMKKGPTPLTADMLNELNKNHMGGFDNYGAEDAYNLEDTWDERRQDIKPKRMQSAKGSNPNLYDSWRSQHIQRYQADEFYYDSHDPYNEFKPKQVHSQNHPYSSSVANRFMEPNWNDGWNESPYNHGSSHNYNTGRRHRDYDQHF